MWFLACTAPMDSASPVETQAPTDSPAPETLDGSWVFGEDTVTVEAEEVDGYRLYTMTTTHALRDGAAATRSFAEQTGDPQLRSGVLLTDALFALAVHEARLNAVEQIQDGSFEQPVDCSCYQTGEKWSWVWTRDIAYATELGLIWLDPERAANSLLFKLSEDKSGGDLQIVQDTGTGGSWPVSTDRVTWARGAMAVLEVMDHPELEAATLEALRNTASLDRHYAWDARDGLYRGETSFLDWREQSYPAWTANNVGHIGMSKALSTNLNHLFALRALEELSGEDHGADALAAAIDEVFWVGPHYSSFVPTELDARPVDQQDLLGTSLAVLDLGTHPEAMKQTRFGRGGPAVIWPQLQFTPIYHNRGAWPFVTAYALLAAKQADNGAVFDASLQALVRGAALNLSHMENFEFVSGANWLDDGDFSGPVVNSERQLWSVAGFVGAVVSGVFGVSAQDGQLSASPVMPGDWFTQEATLSLRGQSFSIGQATLPEGARFEVSGEDWQEVFGGRALELQLTPVGPSAELSWTSEHRVDVYRDGQLLQAEASSPLSVEVGEATACFTVVETVRMPGPPSQPMCFWGEDYAHIQSVQADAFLAVGGSWSTNHGRGHYQDWGQPDHTLRMTLIPQRSGEHLLQLVFGNGAGGVDTGVTAAVKWMRVEQGGVLVAEGPVVMPHQGSWSTWADSSFVPAPLVAGQEVTVTVGDGFNMSYLEHYRPYVAGNGGGEGVYNYVNVAELKLLFRG